MALFASQDGSQLLRRSERAMPDYDPKQLRIELERDESKMRAAYDDANGVIIRAGGPPVQGNVSIGVGHNLGARGLSDRVIYMILDEDIALCEDLLDAHIPWWVNLSDARRRVLINMCFNMGWGDGVHGLSSFHTTLEHIHLGRYLLAAEGMRSSTWATQVGERAKRLAEMMEHG